jgi:hypothetical protein
MILKISYQLTIASEKIQEACVLTNLISKKNYFNFLYYPPTIHVRL